MPLPAVHLPPPRQRSSPTGRLPQHSQGSPLRSGRLSDRFRRPKQGSAGPSTVHLSLREAPPPPHQDHPLPAQVGVLRLPPVLPGADWNGGGPDLPRVQPARPHGAAPLRLPRPPDYASSGRPLDQAGGGCLLPVVSAELRTCAASSDPSAP